MAEELVQALRRAAMNHLSRREHSVFELRLKLRRAFTEASAEQVLVILERLTAQGLQSDARFAEMLIRNRINRGKGPELIRRELGEHNLDTPIVENAFALNECNWLDLAYEQLQHKFQPEDMREYATRVKAMQFLYRRGFDTDMAAKSVERFSLLGKDLE